jgi:GT2 family glycosyltransferase
MSDNGLVSVLVLTRDHPDYFARCSAAVAAAAPPPALERIVVQHGRDVETLQIAERDGWQALTPGRNQSFSAGNNQAARAATGDYLLLLNDDATVEPRTIAAMYERRAARIVGALCVNSERGVVTHHGGGFTGDHPIHTGRGTTAPEAYAHDLRAYWVTFACVLIEHALWDELGGLDEEYFYSYEDVDFCLRARELGVRPLVPWDARVVHDELGTRTGVEERPNAHLYQERWVRTGRILRALENGL